jgi:hypothetical protein
MRLIDADKLNEQLQALAYDDWNQGVSTSWANAYSEAADIVDSAPTVEQTIFGYPVEHLMLIAEVMRKENVTPEKVIEVLTDVGRVASMVRAEFEEQLRKAVERCCTNCGAEMKGEADGHN